MTSAPVLTTRRVASITRRARAADPTAIPTDTDDARCCPGAAAFHGSDARRSGARLTVRWELDARGSLVMAWDAAPPPVTRASEAARDADLGSRGTRAHVGVRDPQDRRGARALRTSR